jgi:hypothetical protein
LVLFATGIVLGELLVFTLADGSSLPLSYSVMLVVAASFGVRDAAAVFAGAELVAFVGLRGHEVKPWPGRLVMRVAVASATYGACAFGFAQLDRNETVGAVLAVLGGAVLAQVVADAIVRWPLQWATALDRRGRFTWIALGASGMLMAIGYRGVHSASGTRGSVGAWLPLLAGPLLATWYASERLAGATRAFQQTNEALAMAPELAGMVPAGHSERVRAMAGSVGGSLGFSASEIEDLETAALLHHFGQVVLDEPVDVGGSVSADVAALSAAMLREVAQFERAGDIVASQSDDPRVKLAAELLRCVCEYDLLTTRDNMPSDHAIEALRTAPSYVYRERVITALERAVRKRTRSA